VRRPPYLTAPEAADYLRCSLRSLHGRTAADRIPYRRLGGMRHFLFLEDELRTYIETGCELEVVETADGGKIVRPKTLDEPPGGDA
jgi:excisionase family DNA binding protein